MKIWPLVATGILCIVITLLLSYLFWGRRFQAQASPADPTMIDAAAKGKASAVFIFNLKTDTSRYYGSSHTGSGVIISPDGYIVTNHHVIEGGVRVQVQLDNRHEYTAAVIGSDTTHDVALLKINATGLPYVEFGNSDSLRVGEPVIAVGSPYRLQATVTGGIVSAKDRDLKMPNNATANYIQIDAPINLGNSGGAMLNHRGELMGLNIGLISSTGQYEGFSFTIPSNLVKKITDDLMQYGKLRRASSGMAIREVDGEIAQQAGLKGIYGVVVEMLTPDGAADKAGIQSLDILTTINGSLITSSAFFRGQLGLFRPGDVISLGVVRDGGERMIEVEMQEPPGK